MFGDDKHSTGDSVSLNDRHRLHAVPTFDTSAADALPG